MASRHRGGDVWRVCPIRRALVPSHERDRELGGLAGDPYGDLPLVLAPVVRLGVVARHWVASAVAFGMSGAHGKRSLGGAGVRSVIDGVCDVVLPLPRT